ncbi:eukaryotic translation initiation factor 2C 2 [Dothidotthia symphoricarpi CBS 119687]|uniref:Eukaryotic translation initiation factor 2C 2 n=1 Tax=Dothidotthia symphoricarpi CBS 119687 TaxID=1392245 RepID=A0A6A6AD71_9PLEO|nr:eukaryotic translation initiation factor 2C 2 [Dothidotthia symphoricarpi CBS 119687]KAF2129769.1 eukaryotic translation initiation factor 2C 2 [Dothidotthia symphoricarpi CBS 119687]
MAGPSKKRAQTERTATTASSTTSRDPTQRSIQSIPKNDGNRDPGISRGAPVDYSKPTSLKNISEFLGLAGWYTARGMSIPDTLPQRPKNFNIYGKECAITLNTFNVAKAPSTVVHQYDIAWGGETDPTKRVLIKKIWYSKAVKAALGEPKNLWVYDGNKLAWSGKRLERDETRIVVDLDEEQGRPAREGKTNTHTVYLRWTRQVDFSGLNAFLNGQAAWSHECIDTINFLDHVMREWPSQNYTQIKKSFFQRGEQRFDLGGGIEAFKGVFASLRPVLDDKFQKSLSVNVDVANGTFWRAQELTRAVGQVFNCGPPQFAQRFKEAKRDWKNSHLRKDLRRFRRVGVSATHVNPHTQWTIDDIADKDAMECTFPDPDDRRPNLKDNQRKQISIYQYFKTKYNINCTPGIPVVRMTKKIRGSNVHLPMDVLKIDANQRYNTKLSDTQTSSMIKFAVTLPKERWAAVQHGVRLLNWANDPYLRHYGLQVNTTPAKVKARVLPSPVVHFGAGSKEATIKPQDLTQGRWRLDGRKFAMNNKDRPLKGWGVCCIQGRGSPPQQAVEQFFQKFVQIYESHGGLVMAHPQHGKKPWMGPGNLNDAGEMIQKVWQQTGNRYASPPMFLFFIVNDRNIDVYRRIKKGCDIRFGVASQVLQSKHVMTASPQYISNVCMKVNAKLGGATCVAKSQLIPKIAPKHASTPTMVVGADVSHPAPGAASGEAASFAAITVSADVHFAKYWAEVQTNGNRVEMVTTSNIEEHFGFMAKNWMQRIGQGQAPKRVLYIRDGVSEGQYAAVLEEEVRDMKECFRKLGCKVLPAFTVVIAGKRHHIRFFPDQGKGDRNGNPLPGTLVESGCTHPFEFDFYLCAHVAIKGTARPIHYQCILNEGNWLSAELQQFIFEHSYQYVRSTTPVSLHPAVYYAHLAADRSRAHLNDSPVSSGKKEAKADQQSSTGSSSKKTEISPLLAIQNARGLKDVMWFI